MKSGSHDIHTGRRTENKEKRDSCHVRQISDTCACARYTWYIYAKPKTRITPGVCTRTGCYHTKCSGLWACGGATRTPHSTPHARTAQRAPVASIETLGMTVVEHRAHTHAQQQQLQQQHPLLLLTTAAVAAIVLHI